MKHTLTLLASLILSATSLRAADVTIENEVLAVRYDAAERTFSLLHKPTQRVFVKKATFPLPVTKVWLVAGPVRGQGKGLEFGHADGSVSRVDLCPGLAFAVFSRIVRNSTKDTRVVDKMVLFDAELAVGRAPNDLRVSGSRGSLGAPGNKAEFSHVFAAVADPQSRRGVVGGWLTHDRGAGIVITPVTTDKKAAMMRPQIDYGAWRIEAGKDGATETFALGWFEDARLGLEVYADAVKDIYRIRLPKPPVGLCTWYMEKNQFSCSEKELPKLVEFAARELKPFGFDFIQLDDGWQAGESHFSGPRKQFLNVNKGAFPSGMKAAADGIKAAGLTPGIWFIPFAGDSQDPYFAPHQDWFIKRNRDGKPFDAYWGGTCLDMTHDGGREDHRHPQFALARRTFRMFDGKVARKALIPVEGELRCSSNHGFPIRSTDMPACARTEIVRQGQQGVYHCCSRTVRQPCPIWATQAQWLCGPCVSWTPIETAASFL